MSTTIDSRDREQLGQLVELAGSAAEVREVVHELATLTGRTPQLGEVVNAIMERKREGALSATCSWS